MPYIEPTERVCSTCKYLKGRIGTYHISCSKAFDAENNPMAEILSILGGVDRTPLPGPTTEVDFHPVTQSWPGCGAWPSNFDQNIVRDCEGYEPKEKDNG